MEKEFVLRSWWGNAEEAPEAFTDGESLACRVWELLRSGLRVKVEGLGLEEIAPITPK